MGASTGNMLVDDPRTLDAIFRDCPTPIITHCEDTPMIDANLAKARAIYGEDIPVDLHARDPLARGLHQVHANWRSRWRDATTPRCTCCTSAPPTNWRCSTPAR